EGARIARELGVTRVVLPRELSIEEIRTVAAGTDLELECFVHGALCVSWSGQCLTSEALQHRSANRGQCAQSCRLPYDLMVEGRAYPLTARDEEELRYSFSRSFSHGFLRGSDHQELVHGLYPGHRGVLVGRVEEVHARARHVLVRAEPDAPELKAGDRILFDQGKPEDDEPRGGLHACDVLEP